MRHAIGFALHWPERRKLPVERLDLAALSQLTFRDPEETRWPALRLAREVMAAGGHTGAVFNAAKERALDHFIAERIGFMQMGDVVEEVLSRLSAQSSLTNAEMTLDSVLGMDHLARKIADEIIAKQ
jgi:1-deoxy-D-xylulose-5-phosphate reductoisomerase